MIKDEDAFRSSDTWMFRINLSKFIFRVNLRKTLLTNFRKHRKFYRNIMFLIDANRRMLRGAEIAIERRESAACFISVGGFDSNHADFCSNLSRWLPSESSTDCRRRSRVISTIARSTGASRFTEIGGNRRRATAGSYRLRPPRSKREWYTQVEKEREREREKDKLRQLIRNLLCFLTKKRRQNHLYNN